MRKTLGFLVLFLLACSGALNSLTPALPIAMPAGSNTTDVSVNTSNGVGTTEVGFVTPSADAETVLAGFETELANAGWTVTSTYDSGAQTGVLTATKGAATLTIRADQAGEDASFDIVWVE